MHRVRNFIRFSRLHTVIGTAVSVTALYYIAVAAGKGNWSGHLQHLVLTLLACLGANIYIVGLNQITDIEIDRVNKPYLPLASGAYTVSLARRILFLALLPALAIGIFYGGFLLATILVSLFLGTIYSLPPIRLKRFYFWAAFCIIAVRGLVVNFLLFLHYQWVINHSTRVPPVVLLLAGVIFIYSVVIAWFKDIPDMEGDRRHRISTLTLDLGANRVFLAGNGILLLVYVAVMAVVVLYPGFWQTQLLLVAHGFFLLVLLYAMLRTIPSGRRSMSRFYQLVWVLFFLEYIVFSLSA